MTTLTGPPAEAERGIAALTMGGLLAEATTRHGGRQAIVFHEPGGRVIRWNYDQLWGQARSVAKALVTAGAGKGARVGLLMGNRPEWVATAFGVSLTGGVLVPVNTLLQAPEINHVLRHSDVAIVIHQRRLGSHNYDDDLASLAGGLPYLTSRLCLGTSAYEAFIKAGEQLDDALVDARAAEVSAFDDALIIYTSGSTGEPKGVLHGHRAAALQSWRFARLLGLDPQVRVWSAFPFFWSAGFSMVMGATLAAGGCLVLQELFDPGEALWLLESERVTTPLAFPHHLAAFESHQDWRKRDLSALRHVESFTSFGRHPTVHVEDTWSNRAAYGLTETFTIVSSEPADTPSGQREGHQGAILPGNLIRITDPDTGEPQPAGATGEIRVKGPTLMKGYLKVAPEKVFDTDGFFATGDAGFFDEAGRLHWVGRMSGVIKTGGANVSPVEIENELLRHPELKSALAVGVPHPTLGEMVVVCAVAHARRDVDEESVRAFLRGRIASYKVPRRVLFFNEDELRLTANAKIRADELRKLAVRRLAAETSTD